MASRPKISIIIPTYNERDNIGDVVRRLRESLEEAGYDSYEIVVVDDASPDMTWAEAAIHGVRVLVRKREGRRGTGLASAIRAGALAARGEYVVVMDADLQHPPEVVPRLISALERGYDVAVASRYVKGGGVDEWSPVRYAMSRVAVFLTKILLPEVGAKTTDPMSGFFAFKKDSRVVDALFRVRPQGFKFLLDLLSSLPDAKVIDVPYVFRRRERGESKLGARTIIEFMMQVIRKSRVHRFAAVGASGALVNLGVMALLLRLTGNVDLASISGIEASVLSNFALNEAWTFRDCKGGGGLLARLWGYHASSAAGMAVTYAVMKSATLAFGASPLCGQALGILAGFTVNFLLSRNKVWRCRAWRAA